MAFCGSPAIVRFILSRARPTEPFALDEGGRSPRALASGDPYVKAEAKADLHSNWTISANQYFPGQRGAIRIRA